jgi:hypothetical protein
VEEALATRGEQEFKENSFANTCDMLLFGFSWPLSGLSGLWLHRWLGKAFAYPAASLRRLGPICSVGVPLASGAA